MVSTETTRVLLRHAGLKDAGHELVPAIASCVSTEAESDYLEDAITDFLRAMSRLNHELNGTVPSRSDRRVPQIPRELALAVAAVTRMLHRCAERAGDPGRGDAARRGARQIEDAWTGVLAGDVDDLRTDLEA